VAALGARTKFLTDNIPNAGFATVFTEDLVCFRAAPSTSRNYFPDRAWDTGARFAYFHFDTDEGVWHWQLSGVRSQVNNNFFVVYCCNSRIVAPHPVDWTNHFHAFPACATQASDGRAVDTDPKPYLFHHAVHILYGNRFGLFQIWIKPG